MVLIKNDDFDNEEDRERFERWWDEWTTTKECANNDSIRLFFEVTERAQERFAKLRQLSTSVRGALIDHAITAESLLDEIVAHDFSPKDAERRRTFLLARRGQHLRFAVKITNALEVLDRWRIEVVGAREQLGTLRSVRNRLAHSALDEEESDFRGGVLAYGYVDRQGKEQRLTIDPTTLSEYTQMAEKLTSNLFIAARFMTTQAAEPDDSR